MAVIAALRHTSAMAPHRPGIAATSRRPGARRFRVPAVLVAALLLSTARLAADPLTVCSFNVKWVGYSSERDDAALAGVLSPCDVVLVQEIVAPPYSGSFPDGERYRPDPQSAEFFDAMRSVGFAWLLSPEDTGTGEANRYNSSATEWWAAFYRPARVGPADDLPSGFLADDRSDHPSYERVPYAFAFRTADGTLDVVLISVHLKPGDSSSDARRRAEELSAVRAWTDAQSAGSAERDYLIVGDMNFKSCAEIFSALPGGMDHLNRDCVATNTNPRSPRPYDNVLYEPVFSTEIDTLQGLRVIDLVTEMRPLWDPALGPYPGSPYDHWEFSRWFSDHNPILFQLEATADDD